MDHRSRDLAALAALSLATAMTACASGSDTSPGGGGHASTTITSAGTGGAVGTGGTGGDAPENGCKPSSDTVLALDKLYFGDTDWDDLEDTSAWRLFGLDIDGVSSAGTASGVCQPESGASASVVHVDGPGGIDNSFGKNVLPVFLESVPSLAVQANSALIDGDFSILIRMIGLGSAADQGSIPAKVYGGAFKDLPPLFDGNDCWPVAPETLNTATDIESAKLSFPQSSLTGNHWDSVGSGDLGLTLQLFGFQGHVTIHHARVVMDLDAEHQGTTKGIISGVLDTEELVQAIDRLMADFDPSQCSGPAVDAINLQIRRASDIMKDGTQDPAAMCDGISIGLGFWADRVQFGTIGKPITLAPDPCAP